MGKDKQAKTGADAKLIQRQRGIAANLDKLGKRFSKLHARQKRLRQQSGDRKNENLAFARDLRRLQRQTEGLLGNLGELKADGRRMEQRIVAEMQASEEVRSQLTAQDERMAGIDQVVDQLQVRSQELESLGQETSGRADALERQVEGMEQEIQSYAEMVSQRLTVASEEAQEPAETALPMSEEVRSQFAAYDERMADTDQAMERLQVRSQELERMEREISSRADALERHVEGMEEEIQSYAEVVSQGLAVPSEEEQEPAEAALPVPEEVRSQFAAYDERMAGTDQVMERLQVRSRELERFEREISSRADALERHLEVMHQEFQSYAEAVTEQLALPEEVEQEQIETVRETVNGSSNGPESQAEHGGASSNVVEFRRGEAEGPGVDPAVTDELHKRMSGLERLADGLNERVEHFTRALDVLESSQRQLQEEGDSLKQWLEQQGEELHSGQEALRAQTSELDASLYELGQAQAADSETLERLNGERATDLERVAQLEQQLEAGDQRAQALSNQIEGVETNTRALQSDAEQRLDEMRSLQDRAANLEQHLDQVGAGGAASVLRLGELDATTAELAETDRELSERADLLDAETGNLARGQQRLGLWLGMLGLLILVLAGAGYWLVQGNVEQQTLSMGQNLADLKIRLDFQEQRLLAQAAKLEQFRRESLVPGSGINRLNEMEKLLRNQGKVLADQRNSLNSQGEALALIQGEMTAVTGDRSEIEREIYDLTHAVQGMRSELGALKTGLIRRASPVATASSLPQVEGPDWLAAQAPRRYTVQIVAGYDPQVLSNTLSEHSFDGPLARYKRTREGRDWHSLLHGNYSSFEAAADAVADLPQRVRSYGPWVRSFGEIQRQLR